ncbi:MAG: hypothetical protein J6U56_08880 [Spirochaetia bacterium]|nr:hypothetical protein [Spirochaetia bacterium]
MYRRKYIWEKLFHAGNGVLSEVLSERARAVSRHMSWELSKRVQRNISFLRTATKTAR